MKLPIALGLCLTVLAAGVAANQIAAQTTTTPSASPGLTTTPTVLNLVEITRSVPSSATPVSAFTVPAGQTLIVTDVLVTNTGTAAACGAAINRSGGAAAPVTGAAVPGGTTGATSTTSTATGAATAVPSVPGTLTQSDSTITGPLCVGAQTTAAMPLTTGIEFGPGQSVQLLNVPDATTTAGATPAATPGAIAFHLRGMLVAS
jgi:hypothetical protein